MAVLAVRAVGRQLPRPRALGTKSLRHPWRRHGRPMSRLSISHGPQEPPLLTQTIPEHFASVVSKHGDRPAVICRSPTAAASALPQPQQQPPAPARETVLTYHELDWLSGSLARSLRGLGVCKGDRVAVSLGNCAEHAALTHAVFKLGAVLVPLNPGFGADQVASALAHLDAVVLVVGAVTDLAYRPCRGRPNLPLVRALVPDLEAPRLSSPRVPSLRAVVIVDNSPDHPGCPPLPLPSHRALTPFSALADSFFLSSSSASTTAIVPDSPLDPSDTINIQFTSGTTSHPKAAMLTHAGILNNGFLIADRMGLTPADLVVCPPPLFHCFGSVLGYMATATTGAALILPSPAFDPAASLRAASDHGATALYGVATMFVAMLEELELERGAAAAAVLSPAEAATLKTRLRTGIAAGSSVPEALMARLFARLGLPDLVICYGQTETSPVSLMTAPADPLAKRTGSVGRAMPHTAVKVVDPADRSVVLPRGRRGELAASGYLVMKGYWGLDGGDGAAAAAAGDRVWEPEDEAEGGDGQGGRVWMYSGDEAAMDDDGYVAITGRIKDLIIRGGENIHPLGVENCLFEHPLVAEASVVGVPDARYGECVAAFVVPHAGVALAGGVAAAGAADAGSEAGPTDKRRLTEDDLKEWVRQRLSGHLVPRHVFWADEYPKTASGKIQKFKLREMAVQLLAREETARRGTSS
ncbi:hypothetical protein RB597_008894 [Gaeumannomyces tritici]